MHTVILFVSIGITMLLAFFFFSKGNSNITKFICKLDGLDKDLVHAQSEKEISCVFRHVHEPEDLVMVFPASSSGEDAKPLGAIPYKHKAKVLHFMNTDYLHCTSIFHALSSELHVELIDELDIVKHKKEEA